MTIVANGEVEGTDVFGIYARNYGADADALSFSITTAGVTGGGTGIFAQSFGSGAVTVLANGDVEGGSNIGIYARSQGVDGDGMSLSITTEAMVTGGNYGIDARNFGAGALEITANGTVEGEERDGIYAYNTASGTTLSIASQAATGDDNGIFARNLGSGALSIVANGIVSAANQDGIVALNQNGVTNGMSLSIRTEAAVNGDNRGIEAFNYGAGALEIVANGNVQGYTQDGIYARHGGGNLIDITVGAGATVTGNTAGVQIVAGTANSLKNYGTIENLNGFGATAILAGAGDETIDNYGAIYGLTALGGGDNIVNNFGLMIANSPVITGGSGDDVINNSDIITGDVDLGGGNNQFNNLGPGIFNPGTYVVLGAGNFLTNDGIVSPGGDNNVLTTELTGNFRQNAGGVFAVDVNGANADLLEVTGNAELAGFVRPTVISLTGTTEWTILSAAGGVTDNGITALNTATANFELVFPLNGTDMVLTLVSVDFTFSGLNQNQQAIADNLNAIFAAGVPSSLDGLLSALTNLQSESAVANALDKLSPEIYLDTQIATLFSAQNFTSSLMTCPVREGPAAFIKEGQCVWARVSGRDLDQSKTAQTFGFDEQSWEVAGGVQGALGDVWRVGFAGAYEQSKLDTTTNASSDADRIHGGAVIKYNPGKLLMAGAVSGGWGWYETDRPIAFPGFFARAHSDHDVGYVNGRLRAAYQLGSGNWYAKPMVDFDATHVSLDGVNETGAAGVGLNVRGTDETVFSATPALELGAQFGSPTGTLVRPYVRGGATFYDDPDFVVLASFEGAPSGVGPFRIATATDDVIGNVGLGVDLIGVQGASLRLYYEGSFGDLVEQHAGGIKGTLPF